MLRRSVGRVYNFVRRVLIITVGLWAISPQLAFGATDPLKISIGYLYVDEEIRIPLSFLDPERADTGIGGAKLAIKDNNTTGRFTRQEFVLNIEKVPEGGNVPDALRKLVKAGNQFIVVNLAREQILAITDLAEAQNVLLFNIRATDNSLRNQDCRANLLHVIPSRAMLTDALAQFLVWKRWRNWFVVRGQSAGDEAFAAMIKRSAKRFGGKIIGEKTWTFDAGGRRADSGSISEQTEIPLFTQTPDYDVMIIADEGDEFGEYFSYRTYLPRPVAGTQGLIATAWHRSHERWGATQFHNRFERLNNARITPRDYAAWMAIRTIGEAATRTGSGSAAKVREFVLSSKFALAAFKGRALSYRPWNGQLRQPVLIVGPRMLVSVSPQEGFLHEFSVLDTLGYDQPETTCKFN